MPQPRGSLSTSNVELPGHGEGPDVNAGLTVEQEFEGMARHLGCDMRAQAPECPAGQVFQVAAGVLHLVEGAFDPFPQPVEPPLDRGGPGRALVAARGGQDLQPPGLPVALLPVGSDEALVPARMRAPRTQSRTCSPATRSSVEAATRS